MTSPLDEVIRASGIGPSRSLRGGIKGGVSRGDKAVRTWHQRHDQISPDCGKNGSEFVENGSEFVENGSEFDQKGAGKTNSE